MKHAVIYDRASSMHQKDNWSRQDAQQEGERLAREHSFDSWELRQEIKSGEELVNRPVMKQILDDIEAGRIDALICQDLIRLSRDEDSIDGLIIRQTCRNNNVLIITQDRVYDFANEHDDTAADLEFFMGKLQKRASMKQLIRGMKARALTGGWMGGPVPLGYKVHAFINDSGKPDSDLMVDEDQRTSIEAIFRIYIEVQTATSAARIFNEQGYTIPTGDRLLPRTLLRLLEKPIYAGFYTWGRNKQHRLLRDMEPVMIYRPELQIVSVEVWERANEIRQNRSKKKPDKGKWAKHPFSTLLACPYCGGPMYGRSRPNKIQYFCNIKWDKSKPCRGKSYSGRLVAEAIIPLTADVLQNQLGLDSALIQAADKYGKTFSEAEIEQRIRAEQVQLGEAKSRIIKAIGSGIVSQNEAGAELEELRAKEQRLERELVTLHQKEAVREEYLEAIRALKSTDIEATLWRMADNAPEALRRLLQLIFKPASLALETQGNSTAKISWIVDYEFTEEFKQFIDLDTFPDNGHLHGPLPG